MLPASLDYPFLIAPSVFYNVYYIYLKLNNLITLSIQWDLILYIVQTNVEFIFDSGILLKVALSTKTLIDSGDNLLIVIYILLNSLCSSIILQGDLPFAMMSFNATITD